MTWNNVLRGPGTRYHFCERSCVMSLSAKQQQQQNQTSFTVHDILDEDAYARRGLVVVGGSATELFYCSPQYPPQAVSPPVGLMNPMGQMNGAMTSPYHGYVHHQLTGHHHHPSAASSFATQYCPGSELTHYNSANPMQGVRNSTTSPWYAAAGSDPRLTSKYNIQV